MGVIIIVFFGGIPDTFCSKMMVGRQSFPSLKLGAKKKATSWFFGKFFFAFYVKFLEETS